MAHPRPRSISIYLATAFIGLTWSVRLCAQESESGEPDFTEQARNSYDFGFFTGPLLPAKVPGVREIVSISGLRTSIPTARGVFEIDGFTGRGEGIIYQSLSLDYRLDVANEYLPVHFLLGAHGDWWQPPRKGWNYGGGWHYGGGITGHISGPLYFRSDFKFRFGPGQSLVVGVGLLLRFPDGDGSR